MSLMTRHAPTVPVSLLLGDALTETMPALTPELIRDLSIRQYMDTSPLATCSRRMSRRMVKAVLRRHVEVAGKTLEITGVLAVLAAVGTSLALMIGMVSSGDTTLMALIR